MGIAELIPDNSIITLPGTRSYEGANGVEMLFDADCQAYTAISAGGWLESGANVASKEPIGDLLGFERCMRVSYVGGNDYVRQSVLTIGENYRIRGWCRPHGGCRPMIRLQNVNLWLGDEFNPDWQYIDFVGSPTTGSSLYLYTNTSPTHDYAEFCGMSCQHIQRVTPAMGKVSRRVFSAEKLIDGDMETAGVGSWTAGNDAILSKETTNPLVGTQVLRITYDGTNSPSARQIVLTVGDTYRITGYCRGDGGAGAPRVYEGGVIWTGTNSTDWQYFELTQIATSDRLYLHSIIASAGYVEFDQVSVMEIVSSGAVPLMGSDGETAAEFPTILRPRGYTLDGNDQINCGDSDAFSFVAGAVDQPFTLAALVNLDVLGDNRDIITKATGASAGEYYFFVAANGEVIFRQVDDSAVARKGRRTTVQVVFPGIPTVIVVTSTGVAGTSGINIYIDDVARDNANTNNGVYTSMQNTAVPLRIGAGGNDEWDGDIVLPMVFDWSLSQIEVKALTELMRRWAGMP
jgi:hypothetical protein